jgi:hypothetical protein
MTTNLELGNKIMVNKIHLHRAPSAKLSTDSEGKSSPISEHEVCPGVFEYGDSTAYSPAGFASLGDIEWIVEGILPTQAIAVLYAKTSNFKTFFGLDLMFSVASGTEFMGRKVIRENAWVAYYYLEDPWTLNERWQAWQREHNAPEIRNVRVWTERENVFGKEFGRADDIGTNRIIRRLQAMPEPPALVIFDTVSEMFAGEADENQTSDMQLFVQAMKKIRTAVNCSVLVIHHEGPRGDLRGSKVLKNDANVVIHINDDTRKRGVSDDGMRIFRVENLKQRGGMRFSPLWFQRRLVDTNDGNSAPVLDFYSERPSIPDLVAISAGGPKVSRKAQRALEIIEQQPEIRDQDLADALGKQLRTVRNYAIELATAGLIHIRKQTKQGGSEQYYSPAPVEDDQKSEIPTSAAA